MKQAVEIHVYVICTSNSDASAILRSVLNYTHIVDQLIKVNI